MNKFNHKESTLPLKLFTGDEISAFCECLSQHYKIVRGGNEWIPFLTTFQSLWYTSRHLNASEFAANFDLEWMDVTNHATLVNFGV